MRESQHYNPLWATTSKVISQHLGTSTFWFTTKERATFEVLFQVSSFPECVAEGFPFEGWCPGVQEATKSRCVYVRQTSASVRKRLQTFASVGECRASSGVANRRETQNCRHFWTRLGSSRLKSVNSHREKRWREERGERREEGRGKRGEKRGERREETGEKRRERGERREERREKRKERGGERGERDDPGPKSPKWFCPWGVIIIACT